MGSSNLLPPRGQPTPGPDPSFKTAAKPNIVTFGLQRVSPPGNLYIQRDDVVSVYVMSSVPGLTLHLTARLLQAPFPRVGQPDKAPIADPGADPDASNNVQVINTNFQPPGTRVITQFQFPLTEGYLLGLSIGATLPGLRKGQCYVQIYLGRTPIGGGLDLVPLAANYVTALTPVGWPNSSSLHATDGVGIVRSVQQANPSAGADLTITVPTGTRWQLLGLNYTLTTGAAVANRVSTLILDDGANVLFTNSQAAVQAASLTVTYTFTPLGVNTPVAFNNTLLSVAPSALLLQGWRIRSSTVNLQAADQYSAISAWVMEWLES